MVAANGFYSRLRIFSRYLGQRKVDGYGRYTLLEAHDASYAVLPQSLDEILASGLFSRTVLYDIERNVLFDSRLDARDPSEVVAAIMTLVRSRAHQPLERLLSDAQSMRRLAMELGCGDVVMADVTRLIDDLIVAIGEETAR